MREREFRWCSIPGIQGRWEWMQPSIDALARECESSPRRCPASPASVRRSMPTPISMCSSGTSTSVLDASGVASAVICGVSFGGLIALRYAATRGDRVRGLILVSTPGPALEAEADPGAICKVADAQQSAVRARRRSPRLAGAACAASASAFEAVGLREHRVARRRERRQCRAV